MECDHLPRELNVLILMHSLWEAPSILDSLLRYESQKSAHLDSGQAAAKAAVQDRLKVLHRKESEGRFFLFVLLDFHVSSGSNSVAASDLND